VLQLAIKDAPHSSSKHRETTYHCCCCVLLHSLRESLHAQNSREQASKTSSSCDTCTGRRAIKFLGAQLCATAHLYERLLPGGASFCITTSRRPFVGRHCFHSFCIKLDRLLHAAQHVDYWERHHRSLRYWSCLWV
jgi:hypothetical protein